MKSEIVKYIGTWVYLDSVAEQSNFPNNKGNSSTPEFQAVYWRCIVVFFKTSLRFHAKNPGIKHILFTNTETVPVIDGMDLGAFFKENDIEVVTLKNKYPLPQDYFQSFRNQFFEFSIVDFMATKMEDTDAFLLLDSDCVFNKDFSEAFDQLKEHPAATMNMPYEEDYIIHGITRNQMQLLFEEFGLPMKTVPVYCGGEILLASGKFIKAVAAHFPQMFKSLLQKNEAGQPKFNEEAHALSFYYYKHGAKLGEMNHYIKRMWTNRNHFRNIESTDTDLYIWHLPNEKPVGFANTFDFINKGGDLSNMDEASYSEYMSTTFLRATNHALNLPKFLLSKTRKILQR